MTLPLKVKDSVILENEVTKDDGKPHGVHPVQPQVAENPHNQRLRRSPLVGIGESSSMDQHIRWRNTHPGIHGV